MSGVGRRVVLVAAASVLIVAGLVLWHTVAHDGARVVDDPSTADGWQTIEYDGVRVDLPADWVRSDRDGCEFVFERWAEPEGAGCDTDGDGLSFYVSATFDPAHGPGVRRGDPSVDGAAWAGYAEAGGYAVYVSGSDRELVATVLASVRD